MLRLYRPSYTLKHHRTQVPSFLYSIEWCLDLCLSKVQKQRRCSQHHHRSIEIHTQDQLHCIRILGSEQCKGRECCSSHCPRPCMGRWRGSHWGLHLRQCCLEDSLHMSILSASPIVGQQELDTPRVSRASIETSCYQLHNLRQCCQGKQHCSQLDSWLVLRHCR